MTVENPNCQFWVKPFVLYFQPDVNILDGKFKNIQKTVNVIYFININLLYNVINGY
jgi:hypothetical protein